MLTDSEALHLLSTHDSKRFAWARDSVNLATVPEICAYCIVGRSASVRNEEKTDI